MHNAEDRSFVGHPRGLGYIAFTEAWERFSYYGMQSLLVLYMVKQLLLPGHIDHIAGFVPFHHFLETIYRGHLDIQPLASAIFGLYTGLVYLTPILGGLLADRLLGRTRTIVIGALLMAAGQFLIAFDVTFLVALACLLIGVGCFKGNLASQVGALYATGDNRRADAFQIYFIFINAGVIISPLIAGTLGEVCGWQYGFGAAGVGMLIGLAIYLYGRKWLPPDSPVVVAGKAEKPRLTRREKLAMVALLLLLPVLTTAVIGNQQIFNAYLIWAERNANLIFFGKKMPTTWLITLDSIVSVSFLALAVIFWRLWSKKFPEPPEITKIGIGSLIAVTGFVSLAMGAAMAAKFGTKVSIGWLISFHVLNSIGFANIFPVSLALYARAAPAALSGTIIGIYYLAFFAANNLVGTIGGLLEKMPATHFWLLHSALCGTAGVIFLLAGHFFGHLLAPSDDNKTP
jgi:proton-dependent oligopeptide transporter, POT family